MAYVKNLLDNRQAAELLEGSLNEQSMQSDATPHWEEGRAIDMAAFDQLPRVVRDHINEHNSFYPIEDVLYEHLNDHKGDAELTLVWLLEGQDLERELFGAL